MVVLLFRTTPYENGAKHRSSHGRTAPVQECTGVLEWNDLRYFLAVYRARTLAGAARTLGVEHTTVGRRLATMERALGATLFVRTPGGLLPTESAGQILPLAEQAERAVQGIERVALGEDSRPEGTVRVTTSETFATFLGRRLGELHAKHPGVTVEVLVGNANLDLTRGEADIAIRIAPTTQPDLVCRKLAVAGWSAYASQSYVAAHGIPSPITNLSQHNVIAFNDSLSKVPGALWLEAHGRAANVVLRSGSIPAAWNAALGGLGIAIVPCFLAEREDTIVRLTPELLGTRDIFLVVHPDLTRVARVRVVMDFLVDRFTRDASVLAGTMPNPA
jgi:DNA-binding transcriptional LysR family regulator